MRYFDRKAMLLVGSVLVLCVLIVTILLVWTAVRGLDWKAQAATFLFRLSGAVVAWIIGYLLSRSLPGQVPVKQEDEAEERKKSDKKRKPSGTSARKAIYAFWLLFFILLTFMIVWSTVQISIHSLVPGIQITDIPPSGVGGTNIKSRICGVVAGVNPRQYRVVLFSETDMWYVEPDSILPMTGIQQDGHWCNSIYLGHTYAALLVRPGYHPPTTGQALPQIGEDVVASAMEEGKQTSAR
ncbi:MAG: hypothetical protein WCF54_09930 [Terracidiphilus sp.]